MNTINLVIEEKQILINTFIEIFAFRNVAGARSNLNISLNCRRIKQWIGIFLRQNRMRKPLHVNT